MTLSDDRLGLARLAPAFALLLGLGFADNASAESEFTLAVRLIDGRHTLVASNNSDAFDDAFKRRTADWEPKHWQALLSLRVEGKLGRSAPAMLGDYRVHEGKLFFRPRFPLRPGVKYLAVLSPANLPSAAEGLADVERRFTLPQRRSTAARVVQVYPTADRVPANLLKFYIQFSAPVRQGNSLEHVRLTTSDGRPVNDAFVNVGQELWDPSGQRLTVLFDPGRIKVGIRPNEELGAVLMPGKEYVLSIDPDWRDDGGQPLSDGFQKRFTVVAPDAEPPDPQRWKVSQPRADSSEPLHIEFDEPLDAAFAEHAIDVLAPDGKRLEGKVRVDQQETRWTLTPQRPWSAGQYTLRIDGRLEDLAANSVGRPFEVPISDDGATPDAVEFVTLPLRIERFPTLGP